jgi:hypothetical protein
VKIEKQEEESSMMAMAVTGQKRKLEIEGNKPQGRSMDQN